MKKGKFILAATLIALAISACSSGESDTTASSEAAEQNTTAEQHESTTVEESKDPEISMAPFEEILVVDNDKCSIKITELEPDNIWGFTLKAELENKSSDKTYMFSVSSAAINGVQSDPFFATEVAPGKKSRNDISFSESTLKDYGISELTDIEMSFRVYDSNDWGAGDVAKETVHVYPYGEDKATVFVREPEDTDKIIVDNDAATVIVTGYTEDDIWGYTANLFLVNKTDKEVMFSVEDASVNGYMADPFFSKSVIPGKCAFTSMSWGNSTLEENGIENVEEIEFTIKIYDANDWVAEPYAHETITLTP